MLLAASARAKPGKTVAHQSSDASLDWCVIVLPSFAKYQVKVFRAATIRSMGRLPGLV
jgi:hypothetical protein